ncbi:MAG: Nucleotide-binding universal stress protein [Candidatus Alkanophagales archaeon MCA70_species_1]|nr:Nucleotide-binding universal stress protein [Candidatus Alkanophaga volatiphilum]
MYKKILLPVDGSAASLKAMEHAIELAKVFNAEIRVLYVMNEVAIAALLKFSGKGKDEIIKDYKAAAEKILSGVEEKCKAAGVRVETCIREGMPAEEIVLEATESGADITVMGTHGYGSKKRKERPLIGSTAERVVATNRCPTLVIPS